MTTTLKASRKAVAAMAAALPLFLASGAFADAQEKLVEKASKELLEINDEMLKSLKKKPEELEGKDLYIRAHVQPKANGASELKIEEIYEGERKCPVNKTDDTVYLKGTLKEQPDRKWKLSIDDVLPKEPQKTKDGDSKGK